MGSVMVLWLTRSSQRPVCSSDHEKHLFTGRLPFKFTNNNSLFLLILICSLITCICVEMIQKWNNYTNKLIWTQFVNFMLFEVCWKVNFHSSPRKSNTPLDKRIVYPCVTSSLLKSLSDRKTGCTIKLVRDQERFFG